MSVMGIGVFNKGDGCSVFPNVLPLEPFILGTGRDDYSGELAASPCLPQAALTSTLRLNRSWGFSCRFRKTYDALSEASCDELVRVSLCLPPQSPTQELPK